jgi:hypothetical protein
MEGGGEVFGNRIYIQLIASFDKVNLDLQYSRKKFFGKSSWFTCTM